MREGGILPAIIGTLYLTLGTAVFSVPLGIAAAIYLSEVRAADTPLTRTIRIAIINLAGIPSVVYGLFGLGLFVLFLKFGTSILAASLTLSIMTLPVIISTAEESLRSVPQAFRTPATTRARSWSRSAWEHSGARHPTFQPRPCRGRSLLGPEGHRPGRVQGYAEAKGNPWRRSSQEKKPPTDLQTQVEQLIKRYANSEIRNNGERFRYQGLSARYTTFNELWRKRLRAREEGKVFGMHGLRAEQMPPPRAAAPAPPPRDERPAPAPGEIRVTDASRDTSAVQELYNRFVEETGLGY